MKGNILFVAMKDGDCNAVIREAAAKCGREVWQIENSRRVFEILKWGLGNMDLVVIDLDPRIHPLSVLEALSCRDERPPVIVLTSLEEAYMNKVARRHGAAACLGKPFTADHLASLMRELCPDKKQSITCDLWGHPLTPAENRLRKHASEFPTCVNSN